MGITPILSDWNSHELQQPLQNLTGRKYVYKNSQECQKFLYKPSALAAPAKQTHRAARNKSHQTFELMRLKSNWVSTGRAGIQRGATAPSKTTGNCNSFCKQQRWGGRKPNLCINRQAWSPGKEERSPGSRNTPFPQQHCHINTVLSGGSSRWQINWEPGALWQRHRALVAVPAVLAVPCTGTRRGTSRGGSAQGDAQTHRIKVKSNSGQGQKVLSSKMSLTAALPELETLRNVTQVVMEKSLPHFLQTEEQNISANRLKQTYSLLCRRLKIQQMSQE